MLDVNKLIMEAIKSHDKVASETYKLLKAKILEFKTQPKAPEYNDAAEINIIKKMIEERKNTAQIYLDNNRPDLADEESKQMNVLEALMPKLPTKEDIINYIDEHYPNGIEKTKMGTVVKEIKEKLVGSDGKTVAELVKYNLINL